MTKACDLNSSRSCRGASLAVVALSHVKDDSMSVKLGCGVTVHGPGGIVLEFSRNEFASRLGWMIAADASLGVAFEFVQSNAHALAMGFAHAKIAADQGG